MKAKHQLQAEPRCLASVSLSSWRGTDLNVSQS